MRVWYWLSETPEEEVTLTFLDAGGEEIRSYTSAEKKSDDNDDGPSEPRVPAEAGMNRFDWGMRYPGASTVPGDKTTEGVGRGPMAPPGTYQVRLTVGEQSQTVSFDLVKDPRVDATQEDFDAQFALAIQVRDKITETHDNINRLRSATNPGRGVGQARQGHRRRAARLRRRGRADRKAQRHRVRADPDRVQGRARPPPLAHSLEREARRD